MNSIQNSSFDFDTLSLDSEELICVKGKYTQKNQLAFAVMLKFFQAEGSYPHHKINIPDSLINCSANQLEINPQCLDNFNWQAITAKRYRQEIRTLLDYNEPTADDSERLIQWLMEEILPLAPTLAQCHEYSSKFFRKHRLEPFSQKQLNRSAQPSTVLKNIFFCCCESVIF